MTGRRQRWDGARWDGARWEGAGFGGPRPDPLRADGLRIGDAERDAASAALGEHFAAGRLTRTELDDRTTAAWAARTRADLAPLFTDLPEPHGEQPSARTSEPGQVVSPLPRRRFPWVVWIAALIALTIVTDVPPILLALGLWFVLSRLRDWGRPRGSRAGFAPWPPGQHGFAGPWGHGCAGGRRQSPGR